MNLSEELISKKYADSYYLSKGESLEKKKAELEKVMEVVKKEINYFTHPLINVGVKKMILDKICDADIKKTSAYRLMEVLISNGRIKSLDLIYSKFVERYLESAGFYKVELRARYSPNEEEKNKINQIFFETAGKKAVINFQKDENIIGGFILKWKDKIFDSTLNHKINSLREEIEKEL